MKKKLLSVIFAFAIILTAGICLTACGGNNNPPEKKLSHITAVVNHNNWDGSQFNFDNEDIIITESNFTVTAHYSNGSPEVVTNFTLDTSNLPYSVSITYGTASPLYFSVNVNSDQSQYVDLSSIPAEKEFTYTGNEINVISQIPELQTLINENKVIVDDSYIDNTSSATNHGSYELHLKTAPEYQSSYLTIYWKINKAKVAIPVPVNTAVEYDGNPHGIQFTQELPNYLTMDYQSYTDADTYQYVVYINNENYIFTNSDNVAHYNFEIKRKNLGLNINGDDNPLAVTNNIVYKEDLSISDIEHNIDTNLFDVDFTWYNNASSSVDNFLYVYPKENAVKNYKWKNGNPVTYEDIYVYFTVAKATCDYSSVDTANNVVFEATYDEDLTFGDVISLSYLTTTARTWMQANLDMNNNYEAFELINQTSVTPGTYTKTISYTPDSRNYASTEITVKVVINKIKVTISRCYWNKYKIDDEGNETWTNNSLIYDGTTAFKVIIDDILAYDQYSQDVEIDFNFVTYYGTEDGVYNENQPITTAINGGYYKTVAVPTITMVGNKTNTSSYNLSDYYEITSFNSICEWRVFPKSITGGSFNLGFNVWNTENKMYLPNSENALTTQQINFTVDGTVNDTDITSTLTFYYKATAGGNYTVTDSLSSVGYYKITVELNDYNHNNYNVVITDDKYVVEWQMLPNQYDLSDVQFNVAHQSTLAYDEDRKVEDLFTNLPEGVIVKFPSDSNEHNGHSDSSFFIKFTNGATVQSGAYRVIRIIFTVNDSYYYSLNGIRHNPSDYVEMTGTTSSTDYTLMVEEDHTLTLRFVQWLEFTVSEETNDQ